MVVIGEDKQLHQLLRKPSCTGSPLVGALYYTCSRRPILLPSSTYLKGDCLWGNLQGSAAILHPKNPRQRCIPLASSHSFTVEPLLWDAPLLCTQGDVHILSPVKEVPLASHQLWRRMLEVGAERRHQGRLKGWGSSGTWNISAQSPVAACLFNPSLPKLKSRSINCKADPSFGKVTSPSQRAKTFLLCRAINTRLGAVSTLSGEGSSGSPLHISPRELLTAAVGAGVSDSAGRAVPSAIWSRAAHKAALFSDVRISICIMKQVIGALPIHAAAIGGDSEMRGRVMSNWPQLIWWEFFFQYIVYHRMDPTEKHICTYLSAWCRPCLHCKVFANSIESSFPNSASSCNKKAFLSDDLLLHCLKKPQINPLLNNTMSWQNLVQGWVCGCSASPLYSFFLHSVKPRWPV